MTSPDGYHRRPDDLIALDKTCIPEALHGLIGYAEFWGIEDDWTRDELVAKAPPESCRALVQAVCNKATELDDWLGGSEARCAEPTREYCAFTTMRMAADYAEARLRYPRS